MVLSRYSLAMMAWSGVRIGRAIEAAAVPLLAQAQEAGRHGGSFDRTVIELAHRLNPGRYADDGFLIGEPAWTEQGRDLRNRLVDHSTSDIADASPDGKTHLHGHARFRAPDLLEVDGEGVYRPSASS